MSKGNEYSGLFVNIRIFFIGLIIFLSCSLPIAGGKPKVEKVTTTMRPLSGNEMKELIKRIPEIFTDALGSAASNINANEMAELKQDIGFLEMDIKLKELVSTFLSSIFPNAHFYQLWKIDINPHYPFLIATIGNKLYHMPTNFNRLLVEHNLEVNDKNIIELAKAFVIIALEGKEITFLEGKRINEYDEYWAAEMVAQIKCKIGDGDIQTWKFSRPRDGQFGVAQIFINKKYGQAYQIKRVEKEKSK